MFSRFYPVPNEPVTIQHVFQFAGVIGVLVAIGFAIYLYVQSKLPSVPGEVVTGNLATYWSKPGRSPGAEDVAAAKQYDYIVVGTGTAGAVIASRLSEDPSITVLAIEAGHSDVKQLFSRMPAAFTRLYRSAADHDIKTTPQEHLDGRVLDWPRGKMLGGCSAINAMIYNRGAPDDWDEWERLGNPGWSYKDVRPFFDKSECFTQTTHHPLEDEQLQQHGKHGPWQVSIRPTQPVSEAFIDATAALGMDKVKDFNTHHGTNGVGIFQTFIDRSGQRSSTAAAYLPPSVANRPNLHISVGQTVTRILFDTATPGRKPRAVGVELGRSASTAVRYIAGAKREIIVCAGAVHTPQLLNLSGIGNATDLTALGIPVIQDLPAVGANLADHLMTSLIAKTSDGASLDYLRSMRASWPALLQWFRDGSGPMGTNISEAAAFLRVADRKDAPEDVRGKDEASGPTASDLELLFMASGFKDNGHGRLPRGSYTTLGSILLRPLSRGTITLTSRSPFDPPSVNPRYLSHPHDAAMLTYGLSLLRRITHTAPFTPYFHGWADPADLSSTSLSLSTSASPNTTSPTPNDPSLLAAHMRETSTTLYHPQCTARMGSSSADSAVDARLRVHGVDGLRVADASVFPAVLACHPCAAVVMVGERCAGFVREERGDEGVR